MAPVKVAILPLSKKEHLQDKARELYADLLKTWAVEYDETQSIGKRYRRQDELGTPFCITVDFDTLGEGETNLKDTVTLRDRDSMEQVRLPISEVKSWLIERLS